MGLLDVLLNRKPERTPETNKVLTSVEDQQRYFDRIISYYDPDEIMQKIGGIRSV